MQNALIDAFAGRIKQDFDDIIEILVAKAVDGDMTAMKLILDRVIPARKAVEHTSQDGNGPVNIIIGSLDAPKATATLANRKTAVIEHDDSGDIEDEDEKSVQ